MERERYETRLYYYRGGYYSPEIIIIDKAKALGLEWGGEWDNNPEKRHFYMNPQDGTRRSDAIKAAQEEYEAGVDCRCK